MNAHPLSMAQGVDKLSLLRKIKSQMGELVYDLILMAPSWPTRGLVGEGMYVSPDRLGSGPNRG